VDDRVDGNVARGQGESSLHGSECRFGAVFEQVRIGIYVTGLDGGFLAANRAACEVLGYSESELISRGPVAVTHPEDLAAVLECERSLLARERDLYRYAWRCIRRDGETVRLEACTALERDEHGDPQWFITHLTEAARLRGVEEELRLTRRFLSALLRYAPMPISATRPDSTHLFVNPAWEALMGVPRGAAIGATVADLFGAASAEEVAEENRPVIELGLPVTLEKVLESEERRVQSRIVRFPILGEKGEVQAIGSISSDVTDLAHTEEELRAALERIRGLWNAHPGGIMVLDDRGLISDMNDAACTLIGRPTEECIGHGLDALGWHVIRRDGSPLPVAERPAIVALRSGRPAHDAVIGVYADRRDDCRWLLCNAEPVFAAGSGRAQSAIAVFVDITDRIRADSALAESEARFREMADLLPDMVVELDADGRVTYANRAVSEALGYARADLDAGLRVMDAMDRRTYARLIEALQATEPSKHLLEGVFPIRRRDGGTIPAEINSTRIISAGGELLGYRAVIRDITDRQKAEAAERLAAVGQLAGGVAHEFNNLLGATMLQAEIAAQTRSLEQYQRLTSLVARFGLRGSEICRRLTAYASPREPRHREIAVESAIDASLAVAAHHIENAGVTVTRRYDTAGHHVYADSTQIEEVILNLIINACHAMPSGGSLTIETGYIDGGGGGKIVTAVSDTGTGIRPEHRDRIFDPFFTTKGLPGESDPPGTGLGLSVSMGIVSAHGGTIDSSSEIGAGTTFRIVLPECDEHTAPMPPDDAERSEPIPPPARGCRRARLLVAEDVEELAHLIAAVVETEGREIVCVHDTQSALAALSADDFDLVITDLLMPGGGGRELLATVRTLPDPPKVLVVTGMVEEEVEAETMALGAAAFLRKPFTCPELLQAVEGLLPAARCCRADDEGHVGRLSTVGSALRPRQDNELP